LTAALDVLNTSGIDKKEIEVIVFVTQYPDQLIPADVHTLKYKLGLPGECIAYQINEGCAGYIYGLHLMQSLLNGKTNKYGLLLCGDTPSKVASHDHSLLPLFGDAGTATLCKEEQKKLNFLLGSDGSGAKDLCLRDGFKHGFEMMPKLCMDGINVFMFGISRVPKYLNDFMNQTSTSEADYDYLVLHQANKMMNDRIARKINFGEEKVLYCLNEYGNTSSASIPLTICYKLNTVREKSMNLLCCGFGAGLAWGVCDIVIDCRFKPTLID
jgi:3-oxoacyl-[acyl-carrier-protein] synthase III